MAQTEIFSQKGRRERKGDLPFENHDSIPKRKDKKTARNHKGVQLGPKGGGKGSISFLKKRENGYRRLRKPRRIRESEPQEKRKKVGPAGGREKCGGGKLPPSASRKKKRTIENRGKKSTARKNSSPTERGKPQKKGVSLRGGTSGAVGVSKRGRRCGKKKKACNFISEGKRLSKRGVESKVPGPGAAGHVKVKEFVKGGERLDSRGKRTRLWKPHGSTKFRKGSQSKAKSKKRRGEEIHFL